MHDFLTLKQREHLIKRHKKEEGKRRRQKSRRQNKGYIVS